MKRHAFWIFLSLLGLVWLLLSCDPANQGCNRHAKVVNLGQGCGFGFELNDGARLYHVWDVLDCGTPPLPREVTEHPMYNFQFVEGKRVFLAFKETNPVGNCTTAKPAKITCLKELYAIEI
jgi:hypothetical protein